MTTRWRDNDVYGHMNNAVYYEYVDACVNGWIIASGALEVPHGPVIGLVVETGCVFHAALGFPAPLDAGLAVAHVGTSSVRYQVGLFAPDAPTPAAEAHFVHVYVDSGTRRPVPLPADFRAALGRLQVA
ncbi:acyl-CoA thioesterase [Oceanibium sediminis]|uniref:acyl-CoA thioesterase n=1 Tax=Oceanibium sediminis TaxID=2026339 RepID=UPI001E4775D0|nr:thioesterase family protein [Oceanibium sediminis]